MDHETTPRPDRPTTPGTAPGTAPDTAPERRWTWRGSLAGAVAGGVLAASVAVPVTWATLDEDGTDGTTQQTTSASGTSPASGLDELPQPPTWGGLAPGTGAGAGSDASTDAATATAASDEQSRGVVLIDTTLVDGEAAGTGLVIDATGLVLTNYHVVEGATSVTATVAADGTTYDAEVVGFDRTADVALLQLTDASGLEVVDLDDDGDPAVADAVTAVGNAQGQGSLSASTGTVVALDRSISTADTAVAAGEDLTGLIETDAAVVGGYSGGALLDDEGEVVGITTAASQTGPTESYAVPIDDALAVAEQIESGVETAAVQIGPAAYLGLGIVESADGLGVARVEDGTPAAGTGLAAGDTLVAVGGARATSLATLRSVLATYQPGDRTVLRWSTASGRSRSAAVTLGASPVA